MVMSADDSPLTRASLLVQLRDGANDGAWREFTNLYGPVIYRFARHRGLQDADAADLMQDVLRSVASSINRLDYDRTKGSFRGWLLTISRNKIYNFLSARRGRAQGSGDTTVNFLLAEHPETDAESGTWELEYQRRLAAIGMERIQGEFQPNTWQAFWLSAVEGVAVPQVAQQLKMSAGAIYVAKSRVLARLKDEVDQLRRLEDE
jgi:RNA polymerase sigma-70 factor (ECF subfamily)